MVLVEKVDEVIRRLSAGPSMLSRDEVIDQWLDFRQRVLLEPGLVILERIANGSAVAE